MRFRRKKVEQEEVVSGEVVPEHADAASWALPADAQQADTVDMDAVAPATAAGGASRPDDHGENTTDDSTTVLEQATGESAEPAAVAPAEDEQKGSRKERKAAEEADRRAEEARLADEEAARAAQAEADARRAEEEAREAAEKARGEAEEAAEAQREADEKAREEAERERSQRAAAAPSTTVSGASVASPGLGGDASPRAAAAANASEPEQPAAAEPAPTGGGDEAGPLAPILEHPAVQKKPELLVAGGLAAGFVFAKILKAITSPDA